MLDFTGKKALAILFATVAVGILFFFFSPENIPAPEKTMPSQEIATRPEKQPTVTTQGPSIPKKESLPLRLVGIYEHNKEKTACIENLVSSSTGQYKIGHNIMGATVIQILSGQVVLLKDGQRTVLTLESGYNWASPDNWIDALSQDSFIVSRARLNRKASNVNQLLDEVIPVPHVSDGRIEGFSIRFLDKDGIVNQAGFREGDIIKSVNGQKLDSIKKPLRIYESLRSLVREGGEPVITVEFQRGKKPRTFTYRILHN